MEHHNFIICNGDTDSIMFLRKKGAEILNKSGLGNWENEHPKDVITGWWALAAKAYMMTIKSGDHEEIYFKCKGVRSTQENRLVLTKQAVHALVEQSFLALDKPPEERVRIVAKTMTIHPNSTNNDLPFGVMCTRYGDKDINTVYSKRKLLINTDENIKSLDQMDIVRLVPYGYNNNI